MELLDILLRLSKPERAMKGLVRLADKETDISNARAEAVRCARETIATAEADEESRDVSNSSLMQRWERWSKKQPNPKNPYNWPAIIKCWQDEGHWDHVANHTNAVCDSPGPRPFGPWAGQAGF
jgi:hypothetical protein